MRRVDIPASARRSSLSDALEDLAHGEPDLSLLPRRGRRNAVVHFELSSDGTAIAALPPDMPSDRTAAGPAAAAHDRSPSFPTSLHLRAEKQDEDQEEEESTPRQRRNAAVSFQLSPGGSLVLACPFTQTETDFEC